jgi:hypothetical protein
MDHGINGGTFAPPWVTLSSTWFEGGPIVPDLERTSVLTWLQMQEPDKPDLLLNPITAAEGHPGAEEALVRLGQELDAALARNPAALSVSLRAGPARDDIRSILGQLGTPRALRVIGWILEAGLPEKDAVLAAVLAPDPSGVGQFLQGTLSTAERLPMLERIYAPERLTALLAACQPDVAVRAAT